MHDIGAANMLQLPDNKGLEVIVPSIAPPCIEDRRDMFHCRETLTPVDYELVIYMCTPQMHKEEQRDADPCGAPFRMFNSISRPGTKIVLQSVGKSRVFVRVWAKPIPGIAFRALEGEAYLFHLILFNFPMTEMMDAALQI